MKSIIQIMKCVVQRIIPHESKPLGRWNIDYCTQKMNQKIDLSNEDHCGPCGQYMISKKVSIDDHNSVLGNEKSIVFSEKTLEKSIVLYPKK
jgi:hypothetical protein